MIRCLSCGDIYLSFGISLLASFEGDLLGDFFDTLVILSAIVLTIKSPVV